jgi:hypothetical protein
MEESYSTILRYLEVAPKAELHVHLEGSLRPDRSAETRWPPWLVGLVPDGPDNG